MKSTIKSIEIGDSYAAMKWYSGFVTVFREFPGTGNKTKTEEKEIPFSIMVSTNEHTTEETAAPENVTIDYCDDDIDKELLSQQIADTFNSKNEE